MCANVGSSLRGFLEVHPEAKLCDYAIFLDI